jgi:hypothetical protein
MTRHNSLLAATIVAVVACFLVGAAPVAPGTKYNPYVGWENALLQNPATQLGAGWYKLTKPIELIPGKNFSIVGQGVGVTNIVVGKEFKGTAIRMAGKVNSNTDAHLRLAGFSLINSGGSHATDAGIELLAVTDVIIDRVAIGNFQRGLVIDQTNHVTLNSCSFSNSGGLGVNSIGLWVANGEGRTRGAKPNFTNVVMVRDCFFNAGYPDHTHIRDDGGYSHHYDGNWLNGGGKGYYFAALQSGSITKSHIEGLADAPITLEARCLGSKDVGARCNCVVISDNFMYGDQPQINLDVSNWTTVTRNMFVGHPKVAIVSPFNDSGANTIRGNYVEAGTQEHDLPADKLIDEGK